MSINGKKKSKKIKINDLSQFIYKIGDLINEGYTLSEAITLLIPYYTKEVEYWTHTFQQLLQQGYNATSVFEKFGVKNEFLIAIYFAEKHGDLAKTLMVISEQMKEKERVQRQLKKIVMYPMFMFVALFIFFIAFRMIFLPNMQKLINSRSTQSTDLFFSKLLLHVPDYFLALVGIFILTICLFFFLMKRKHIALQLKIFLSIPFFKTIYQLNLTRQFSRILGTLLIAGFSMQEALQQLKNQQFKLNLTFIAERLEERILVGDTFAQSIKLFSYFTPKFELFVNHGESNGLLGKELILYSDILDQKLSSTISFFSSFLQPILFSIIAVCILAAYLSILLPVYEMMNIV